MNFVDLYDIMLKNIERERCGAMSTDSKWETPIYGKGQINKAGEILRDKTSTDSERNDAMEVLNNWRAYHAYPLQVFANNLRQNSTPNAIIVQRLKRLPSIIYKLQRYPKMRLYRMQDLGGCRVIVDTVEDVYKAVEKLKHSKIHHVLKNEYDYIGEPKASGYRSYHLVYAYRNTATNAYGDNILIEIQFRTKLQHIWATAVEMMGLYMGESLKSSEGNEKTLRFFSLVSSVFALQENCKAVPKTSSNISELISEIKQIDDEMNILPKLAALSKTTLYVEKDNKPEKGYYLLALHYKENIVRITKFTKSQSETATKVYDELERKELPDVDTVLVAAKSMKALRMAYPNYFADISEFISRVKEIL